MPIILVDHGIDFCRLIDLVVLVFFGVSLHNVCVIGFNLSEDACISDFGVCRRRTMHSRYFIRCSMYEILRE